MQQAGQPSPGGVTRPDPASAERQTGGTGSDGTRVMRVVAPPAALTATLALFPISIAVAILRYRLFDIDLLINRTALYGAMTLILGSIFLVGSIVATLGETEHGPIDAIVGALTMEDWWIKLDPKTGELDLTQLRKREFTEFARF